MRRTHPYIRTIYTAIDLKPLLQEAIADGIGIVHIGRNLLHDLAVSLIAKHGLCASHGDITRTIILSTLTAIPQGIERYLLALIVLPHKCLGYNGIATAHTRKACRLTETTHLNSHLFGSLTLIDTVRDILRANKRLVSGIEDNQTMVRTGIVYPTLQLLSIEGDTCRVIRRAEIEYVRDCFGKRRTKAILRRTGKEYQITPTITLPLTGTTCHNTGINIGRIGRVGYGYTVMRIKNITQVTQIGTCPIGHKDLVYIERYASTGIVKINYGATHPLGTILQAIAMKCIHIGLFLYGTLHCLHHGRYKRSTHIPNTQLKHLAIWVLCYIAVGTLLYLRK